MKASKGQGELPGTKNQVEKQKNRLAARKKIPGNVLSNPVRRSPQTPGPGSSKPD